MGHTRLGAIPKTHSWPQVVAFFHVGDAPATDRAFVSAIAAQTLAAAEGGLTRAPDDPGLTYAFYLLARIAQASGSDNWGPELQTVGLFLPPDATAYDLATEYHTAVDEYLESKGRNRTDVGELAQAAGGEALLSVALAQEVSLFADSTDLREVLARVRSRRGFGEVARLFFARFIKRYLNFYLSRITASSSGSSRIDSPNEVTAFNKALDLHAHQTAKIIESFAGHWFSKAAFRKELDLAHTRRFMAVALDKLRKELRHQGSKG